MRVFRIAKEKWISDVSGRGAELYGGRWNFKGLPALYTSESLSLCLCETLVHLDKAFFPKDLYYAELEIPTELISQEFAAFDFSESSAKRGSEWLQGKKSLAIQVPSVVVRQECNVIVNPLHPDFHTVKITAVAPFTLDERLFL